MNKTTPQPNGWTPGGGTLLLLLALLAAPGCASLTTTAGDPLLQDQSGTKSAMLDVDKWPEKLGEQTKALVGKGTNPGKARELYAQAEAEYNAAVRAGGADRADRLLPCAKQFLEAAERWPNSALQEDAMFLAGECYYFSNQYPKANDAYEKLLKKYPNSKHLDVIEARRFSIAQYWLQLDEKSPMSFWTWNLSDESRPTRGEFTRAVKIFDRIRIDDPTGRLADDATFAAGNAYFTSGKYLDADNFYTDLRKTFPSSEHQFRAHVLGVKAKLMSYQGPDYSAEPLKGADDLLKQIRRQFPGDADKEREYLARAHAEVRFRKAERLWSVGQYYDRRAEYRAARMYYSQITRDLMDTPFGEKAQQRMAEIANRPDVPPKRLEWLANLFPEKETAKPLIPTADAPKKR